MLKTGDLQKRVIREDLTSKGDVASPNNAGVKIITGIAGKKIKVYDAGFDVLASGLVYFYFGTSATPTTKRFLSIKRTGVIHQTFIQPRVGGDGDDLYLFSSVAQTNMPYDVGYAQE